MKAFIKYISIFAVMIAINVVPCQAIDEMVSDDVASVYANEILDKINQIRNDPQAMAVALGMDVNDILNHFPELANVFAYGLPPLTLNRQLTQSATGHVTDMLVHDFYSYDSLDGTTYADRIRQAGYDPGLTGEDLGMLTFRNFLDPHVAIEKIVENLFRDELNPDRTRARNILNPDLIELGIGFSTGSMSLGTGWYFNAYLMTLDYATHSNSYPVETGQGILIQLINQARKDPLKVAAVYGIDTEAWATERPDLANLIINGIPPLSVNDNLMQILNLHMSQMASNHEYDANTVDNAAVVADLFTTGYAASAFDQFAGQVMVDKAVPLGMVVEQVFKAQFLKEMEPAYIGARIILNPDLKDVAIGIIYGSMSIDGHNQGLYVIKAYLASTDIPTDDTASYFDLSGVIYQDDNANQIWDLGEGVPGITIQIAETYMLFRGYDVTNKHTIVSDKYGCFSIKLKPALYRMVWYYNDQMIEKFFEIKDNGRYIEFEVPEEIPAEADQGEVTNG